MFLTITFCSKKCDDFFPHDFNLQCYQNDMWCKHAHKMNSSCSLFILLLVKRMTFSHTILVYFTKQDTSKYWTSARMDCCEGISFSKNICFWSFKKKLGTIVHTTSCLLIIPKVYYTRKNISSRGISGIFSKKSSIQCSWARGWSFFWVWDRDTNLVIWIDYS